MTTVEVSARLEERLDRLDAAVAEIAAELRRQREERERWRELSADLAPVARSALESVSRELDELSGEVDLSDLVGFLEDLARALPALRAGLAGLQAFSELAAEVSGLGRPALESLTVRLAELDEKGYFAFAKAGLGVVDNVVTSFSEEDVRALGDNVVLILETIKEMTQPEVMTMLRRTVHTVREDQAAPAPPPSLVSLLREMRDPQVRRGLARVLDMLRSAAPPLDTESTDDHRRSEHGDHDDRRT